MVSISQRGWAKIDRCSQSRAKPSSLCNFDIKLNLSVHNITWVLASICFFFCFIYLSTYEKQKRREENLNRRYCPKFSSLFRKLLQPSSWFTTSLANGKLNLWMRWGALIPRARERTSLWDPIRVSGRWMEDFSSLNDLSTLLPRTKKPVEEGRQIIKFKTHSSCQVTVKP